jgi:hypothetical protein
MHLIINCRNLDSESTPLFVAHLESNMPEHWHLTFCTKPGRDASVAHEVLQRRLPKCRIVAAWSEQEMLGASSLGWREPLAAWWPVGNRASWPIWQDIDLLRRTSERVFDKTGKQCPVGFAGYWDGDGMAVSQCSGAAMAVDVVYGPVLFAQSQAKYLHSYKLDGVVDASMALSLAVGIGGRRCSYIVDGSDVDLIDRGTADNAIEAAKRLGWRSRIAAGC